MKLAIFTLSLVTSATAFQIGKPWQSRTQLVSLRSTVEGSIDVSTTIAKTELLETAESLNEKFGCLIIDSSAQEQLRNAVEKLEAVTEPPSASTELIGNWTLLCSTASASLQNGPLDKINGIDTNKIPFFNEGPLKEIRDTLNKSLKVQQVIKAETMSGVVDRVDHVLQYAPPDTLSAFIDSLPDALKNLDINPLKVSESKFILVHKAEVESVSPVINTKLSLSSIVVNVAGKSKVLDPEGADILGFNVPFGEFLNAGSFETTYMDDKIRISRSKVGIVDQLRVFLKSELTVTAAEVEEVVEEEVIEAILDADIVVDEADTEESEEESETVNESESDDASPSDY